MDVKNGDYVLIKTLDSVKNIPNTYTLENTIFFKGIDRHNLDFVLLFPAEKRYCGGTWKVETHTSQYVTFDSGILGYVHLPRFLIEEVYPNIEE